MAQGPSDTILVAIRIMLRIWESKVRNPDPPDRRRFVLSEHSFLVCICICHYLVLFLRYYRLFTYLLTHQIGGLRTQNRSRGPTLLLSPAYGWEALSSVRDLSIVCPSVCQTLCLSVPCLYSSTGPQSNLRRARRKGPIDSDDSEVQDRPSPGKPLTPKVITLRRAPASEF